MRTGEAQSQAGGRIRAKGLTRGRLRARRNMTELARGWGELEESEREAWRRQAARQRVRVRRRSNRPGDLRPRSRGLRGEEFYVRINRVLAVCGYAPRRLPPPMPSLVSNPVKAVLRIGCAKGEYQIKLGVSGSAPNDIMVFGSPPRRAGQGAGGNYAFLGLLPAPLGGESDISGLYLSKLREWRQLKSERYQVPLAGARICIRTWPQEDGWESKGLMQISVGLAPRVLRAGGREKGLIKG